MHLELRWVALSVAAVFLASMAVLGQAEQTKKCFDAPFKGGARVLAISMDDKFMGAGSFTELYFFRGGIASTGFMRRGYNYLYGLAPHPTDQVMLTAWGKVRIIDMVSRKEIAKLKTKGNALFVAWGKEGTEIVSLDDKFNVQVWDVLTKKPVTTWRLPLNKKANIAFSDYVDTSRLLAVATRDGNVRVFKVDSGHLVGTIMNHSSDEEVRITGLDFHPDGRLLASCSYGQIKVWDLSASQVKSHFSTRPGGLASGIKFYGKGKRLAVANYVAPGYGFMFLDAETGRMIAQGMVTKHDTVDAWDMAFPDYDDPLIVFAAGEKIYECRYRAIIGKSAGIKVIR